MKRIRFTTLLAAALCLTLGAGALQSQSAMKTPRVKDPAWYTSLPKDKQNLIARGRAEAPDMQLAIDKAVVAARVELVTMVETSWQDLLVRLRKEKPDCGAPSLKGGDVALSGTKIRQQKTVKRGKSYTAYVLVSWPSASLKAALLARAQEDAAWYAQVKEIKILKQSL